LVSLLTLVRKLLVLLKVVSPVRLVDVQAWPTPGELQLSEAQADGE
jgi:hypothetical protein